MFERFKQRYHVTSRISSALSIPVVTTPLADTPGYAEFMREYTGATFNSGVYRIHTLEARTKWNRIIEQAFSTYKDRFSVFGCDWMGRQLALDAERRENGEPLVLLFWIDTGAALEVPGTFLSLHENVLEDMSDAVLCDNVFEEWLQAGNRAPGPSECVGHKVPLFLNGIDEFENYELVNMEVHWELTTQLIALTHNLPDGTPIGHVKLE